MAFSRVLTFTDPFPYQAALQGADIRFFPATKGEFRAEMTQLRMNKLWLQRHRPELFGLPEAVRAMELQLSHLMVRCLTESVSTQMTGGGHHHDMIVAKFEEYLEANPNTPLYLAEICAAIDVAERTLRTACEEHLGMGPIRYLALRRMHLVRRALSRAIPSTTTVTKIATYHGFWELGRFSVNYHAMFGETPSATLHRPPDDQPETSMSVVDVVDGCAGRPAKGRRWKSVTVKV